MVTVLVDGYNVIHAIPALARHLDRSLEAARTALVGLCREYRTRRGDVGCLYVVFDGTGADGTGPREDLQGVTVLFTRQDEEADARILSVIRMAGRGRFVVVSNDSHIHNNARALGAQVISVDQFHGKTAPPRRTGAAGPATEGKRPLPTRESERITEEYRKHLEQGR